MYILGKNEENEKQCKKKVENFKSHFRSHFLSLFLHAFERLPPPTQHEHTKIYFQLYGLYVLVIMYKHVIIIGKTRIIPCLLTVRILVRTFQEMFLF